MKYITFIISMLFAMIVFDSCTDDITANKNDSSQGNKELMLNLQTSHLVAAGSTRSLTDIVNEGTSDSYKVSDIVLLEFDENGSRIGDPKYYTIDQLDEPITIVMPQEGKEYTIAVLANYHDPNAIYAFSDATTLTRLAEKYRKVQKMEDLYENHGDESNPSYDVLMNGFQTITASTTELNVTLYRNIAKLKLTINNGEGSKLTIKSVQIKNIPTKMDYFFQLKPDNINNTYYPELNKFTRINYDREELNLGPNQTKELIYYLPCHLMGTTASSSDRTKGDYAPNYATYVELYGTSTESQKIVRYQFYLGDNMTNDYNIRPNYYYDVPLTFTGIGNPSTDSRVVHIDAEITEPEANSYMIHPLPVEGAQQIYNIPVFNRINTFWSQEKNINHISNATAYTISQDDEWVAEILWQTSDQQLIEFYNTDGTMTGHAGKEFPTYKGQVAMKFKPVAGAQGNVLIGVYRKDIATNADPSTREYSWSWHLWITDYNPDECRNQNWDNRYKYALTNGGEVHHYTGEMWNETGMYHNKWMMDRCLGSFSNTGKYEAMGLFYQFGRKDPLPYQGKVYVFGADYTIQSATLPSVVKYSAANTIDYMVKHPTNYYQGITGNSGYNSGEEYIAANPYAANLWNDPEWNLKNGKTEKSFFDPCPPGWRIPEHHTWDDLTVFDFGENGLNFYMDGISGSDNSCWYPAFGAMSNSMANMYYYTSTAYFSSTPVPTMVGVAYGLCNHDGKGQIYYTTGAYTGRQRAASIRPIQE